MKTDKIVTGISELTSYNDIERCLTVLLGKVQEHVVGYRKDFGGEWICIVKNDEYTVKTLQVLKSFGSATDYYTIDNHLDQILLFPDGKTLSDMVKEPFVYAEWCKVNLV